MFFCSDPIFKKPTKGVREKDGDRQTDIHTDTQTDNSRRANWRTQHNNFQNQMWTENSHLISQSTLSCIRTSTQMYLKAHECCSNNNNNECCQHYISTCISAMNVLNVSTLYIHQHSDCFKRFISTCISAMTVLNVSFLHASSQWMF